MSEGFRRVGIEFDVAVDYDADACASHEKNLGLRPVQMDVWDLLRLVRSGWRPYEAVRLLVADPPCTPWSRAGKRLGLADDRDCLKATAELIWCLKPGAYLIGNVPGLQDATQWHVVQDVIGGLQKHGYCVADYVQLDAADYGVPQHRVRPFWFGHRAGPCIRWPEPTHCDPEQLTTPMLPGVRALRPWVTCRQALGHLPLEELGRPVRLRWKDKAEQERRVNDPDDPAHAQLTNHGGAHAKLKTRGKKVNSAPPLIMVPEAHPIAAVDGVASTIRGGGEGHSAPHLILANERHAPAALDAPSHTIGAKYRGQSEVLQCNRLGDPDRPSFTQTTKEARVGTGADGTLDWPWDHPAKNGQRARPSANAVVLSEKARAILQGFPESWVFVGDTQKSRSSQIGMAMPPPLAEAVARSVREQIKATDEDSAA